MQEAEAAALAALLDEAAPNLIVRPIPFPPYKQPPVSYGHRFTIGYDYYEQLLKLCHESCQGYDEFFNLRRYLPDVGDAVVRDQLLDLIRTAMDVYVHEDRLTVTTVKHIDQRVMRWHGHNMDEVLGVVLKVAILRGADYAARKFYETVSSNRSVLYYVGVVSGLHISEETTVVDGVSLVPLIPHYRRDAPGLAPHPSQYPPLVAHTQDVHQLGQTLIVIRRTFEPLFGKAYGPGSGERMFPEGVSLELPGLPISPHEFCEALALSCNAPIRLAAHWHYIGEDEIANIGLTWPNVTFHALADSRIQGLEDRRDDVWAAPTTVAEALQIYNARNLLEDADKERLRVVIDRWALSKTDDDTCNRAINLGVALESLYAQGATESRFKVSVGGALHVGIGGESRKELGRKLGRIYNLRSRAVHDGRLPASVKDGTGKRIPPEKLIRAGQDIVRKAVLNVIKDGAFPNLDDMILDGYLPPVLTFDD